MESEFVNEIWLLLILELTVIEFDINKICLYSNKTFDNIEMIIFYGEYYKLGGVEILANRRELTKNEQAILLAEVENMCPKCTRKLMYEKKGKKQRLWEGAHIYPLNPTSAEVELLKNEEILHIDVNHLDNIIPLCRVCHIIFDHPRTVEEYREMVSLKKNIISKNQVRDMYIDFQIESEITEIIKLLIDELDESELKPLEMTALKIEEKADETLTRITKARIKSDATEYYYYIQKQFAQLDGVYPKSFNAIASQVSSFYNTLSRKEKSQEVIYYQLSEWLSKKTGNSNLGACSTIISFFVQNCEVFS